MEQTQENKLGVYLIPKLLRSMALPLIVANIITALYNIVDGIYVAQLSEVAMAATTLAFPAQLLMQSVASGTATSVNSLLSRRLGAGKRREADAVATHGFLLAVISYLMFLVLGLLLSKPFIGAFSGNAELCTMGTQYLTIVLAGSIGSFLTYSMGGMLEAVGHAGLCMIMSAVGAVTNIVLDPILIFGGLGLPAMGISGAAVATVFSQIVSAVLGIIFNLFLNKDVSICLKGFRFVKRDLEEIYKVGIPSILMQSLGSIMNVGMNKILIEDSEAAVSVFGVYYKMQTFVFMPVFGVTQAQSIIVGYNYGAKNTQRMRRVIKLALISGILIMSAGTAIVHLFPEKLLDLFSAGEDMMTIGVHALRVMTMPFCLSAICIILGDALNGMGIGYVSAINSSSVRSWCCCRWPTC
ncbi:MAG: MATE family efflux transporter [Eubacteriales bacterium]|nr:MATE family efflux transporter [Eubacteriales bacterium]